eukprot:scaffold138008_cov31-Tisochrysis_lutea.AAC.8
MRGGAEHDVLASRRIVRGRSKRRGRARGPRDEATARELESTYNCRARRSVTRARGGRHPAAAYAVRHGPKWVLAVDRFAGARGRYGLCV